MFCQESWIARQLVIFRKLVPGLSERGLGRFVTRACRAARVHGVVNVAVTGNRELRVLNQRFRGKDQPTDVLSFPPLRGFSNGFAGDVAISAEIAAWSARRLGHSTAEEVKILALHGLLHLAGYDHERDRGQMARKEAGLRKQLGLPLGLIERSDSSEKAKSPATGASHSQRARKARAKRGSR